MCINNIKINFNTNDRRKDIGQLINKIHSALGKPIEVDVLDQLREALPK